MYFEKRFLNMYTVFLVSLTFGYALGVQPSVWANDTCPPFAEYENYIILGEDAPEGQYPYMLSLNYEKNKGHACGASVLTKDWALTAGHCCATGSDMYLYSGSNYLSKGGTNHRIEFMKINENYQPNNYWKNDICLIKVKDPFVLGKNVQKVTLPPQNYPVSDGDLVTITGWGYTKPDEQVIPDKLQLGKNFVALSLENCLAKTGQYHQSYLCAVGGKKGQGVCNVGTVPAKSLFEYKRKRKMKNWREWMTGTEQVDLVALHPYLQGDSGSPLVKNGVQVGIASWVYKPCGCGRPDFYSRVPIFIDWIKTTLGKDAAELQFMK